jgi:hypothetical protein
LAEEFKNITESTFRSQRTKNLGGKKMSLSQCNRVNLRSSVCSKKIMGFKSFNPKFKEFKE